MNFGCELRHGGFIPKVSTGEVSRFDVPTVWGKGDGQTGTSVRSCRQIPITSGVETGGSRLTDGRDVETGFNFLLVLFFKKDEGLGPFGQDQVGGLGGMGYRWR